jgi:hypothetical protein
MLTHFRFPILAFFLIFPHFGNATLPWTKDARTLATGGNLIDYNINPEQGITLFHLMPFQLKELSVKRLQAEINLSGTILSGGFGQTGDEVFRESILSLGAGKMLSEKIFLSVDCSLYRINTINGANGSTILTEVVCLYQPDSHIVFGSCLFNPTGSAIKNKVRNNVLEQSFNIGFSYTPEKNISLTIEYERKLDENSKLHFGAEYHLMNVLTLRLGFSGAPLMPSWGIGYKFKRIDMSMGANLHPVLGLTSGISIKYYWKQKI